MSGTVQNLKLENVNINGGSNAGGIAGSNNGTITGCMVTGTVSGQDNVGGVVGYNNHGTVENCYWKADLYLDIGGEPGEEDIPVSTTKVTDGWAEHKDALQGYFTIVDGKPVPNAIANKNTAANNVYIDNPLTRFVLGL